MDTRIWYKIGLELVEIDIESAIESQAGSDRTDDLCNQSVEMFIIWSGDVKVSAANIINRFIVDKEGAVGVFNCAMSRQDGTVWY
jgi:spermidine/putrescine-binding protein